MLLKYCWGVRRSIKDHTGRFTAKRKFLEETWERTSRKTESSNVCSASGVRLLPIRDSKRKLATYTLTSLTLCSQSQRDTNSPLATDPSASFRRASMMRRHWAAALTRLRITSKWWSLIPDTASIGRENNNPKLFSPLNGMSLRWFSGKLINVDWEVRPMFGEPTVCSKSWGGFCGKLTEVLASSRNTQGTLSYSYHHQSLHSLPIPVPLHDRRWPRRRAWP